MTEHGGWFITRSMPLELGALIWMAGEAPPPVRFAPAMAELRAALPDAWYREGAEILGLARGLGGVITSAARIAGCLCEEDYSRATLPIRELSLEAALARAAEEAGRFGLAIAPDLPPGPAFADLRARALGTFYRGLGFGPDDVAELLRRERPILACVPRILRDGDAHARFWHWLDRFVYSTYLPWRATRAEAMAALEDQARQALGGEAGDAPPDTGWLPPQNPLLRSPELGAAVRGGRVRLALWADPFELFDSVSLEVGLAAVTFGQPGATYAGFHELSADIAARTAALADPTRLVILRLIRTLSMSNTDIAAYLELARPTVSVHAKILREAGLIRTRPEGRQVRHEIDAAAVRRLFADLERFLDLPDA